MALGLLTAINMQRMSFHFSFSIHNHGSARGLRNIWLRFKQCTFCGKPKKMICQVHLKQWFHNSTINSWQISYGDQRKTFYFWRIPFHFPIITFGFFMSLSNVSIRFNESAHKRHIIFADNHKMCSFSWNKTKLL